MSFDGPEHDHELRGGTTDPTAAPVPDVGGAAPSRVQLKGLSFEEQTAALSPAPVQLQDAPKKAATPSWKLTTFNNKCPAVNYDHSKTSAEIQAMRGNKHLAGLALAKVKPEMSIGEYKLDGRWMADVTAGLNITSHSVYVPSEYTKGSKEYNVILAHEKDHVDIHERTVKKHGAAMKAAIESIARQSVWKQEIPWAQRSTAASWLERAVKGEIKTHRTACVTEMRSENKKLDARDYQKIWKVLGWTKDGKATAESTGEGEVTEDTE